MQGVKMRIFQKICVSSEGCDNGKNKNCPGLLDYWWQHCDSGSEVTSVPITNVSPAHTHLTTRARCAYLVCMFIALFCWQLCHWSHFVIRHLGGSLQPCTHSYTCIDTAQTPILCCLSASSGIFYSFCLFPLDCSSLFLDARLFPVHTWLTELTSLLSVIISWQNLLLFPVLLCFTLFYFLEIIIFYSSYLIPPTATVQHSTPPFKLTRITHSLGGKLASLTLLYWDFCLHTLAILIAFTSSFCYTTTDDVRRSKNRIET